MRLGDLIQSLQKTDPLSEAYKTSACLSMSYPKQQGRLRHITPLLDLPDTGDVDKALEGSPLMAIVEHLYPLPVSQAQ